MAQGVQLAAVKGPEACIRNSTARVHPESDPLTFGKQGVRVGAHLPRHRCALVWGGEGASPG